MIRPNVYPSSSFRKSISANIRYWLGRTRHLDDQVIQELVGERQNIYRAAEFGIHLPETWPDAANLILQCFYLVERRGFWNEWIPLLTDTLGRWPGDSLHLKIGLLNNLGACYRLGRQFELALSSHEEEMELATQLGDERLIALAHNNMGKTFYLTHQFDEAERHCLLSASYFENKPKDVHRLAAMLNTLGLISQARGDSEEAESRLQEAVKKFRKADIPLELARALANLAITLDSLGEPQSALACYLEAAEILAPTKYEVDKAKLQLSMGTLFFNLDDLDAAASAYEKANSPFMRREGPIYYQAMISNNLGNVLLVQRRLPEAERFLREAISLWRASDANLMLANSLGTLAEAMVASENYQEAEEYYEEALTIAEKFPDNAWSQEMILQFKEAKEEIKVRLT